MGWIEKISSSIQKVFSTVRKPLQPIPPVLLICDVRMRPGLSAIASASSIISRLPEAGIETGVNNCGSPNMNNQLVRIICEELIREIKENARVTCVVGQGQINSIGTGAGVVVTSLNTAPSTTEGIIE